MNKPLSRGALALLKALRRYLGRKWKCWPKQATLARELRATIRSIQRWLHELVAHGCVVVHRQARLYGQNEYVMSQQMPLFAVLPLTTNCRATHDKTVRNKHKTNDLKKPSKELSTNVERKSIPPTPLPGGRRTPSDRPNKPEPAANGCNFPASERQAIEREIHAARLPVEASVMRRLSVIAKEHGKNGYVVSSAIGRAYRIAERTRNPPQGPGWLVAVVRNEFALASRPQGKEGYRLEGGVPSSGTCGPLAGPPRKPSGFEEQILRLAAAKAL